MENELNIGNSNNIKWEKISCPVCGTNASVLLFQKNGERFVECNACNLVYINPRPVKQQLLKTYNNKYSIDYSIKANKKLKRSLRRVKLIKRRYLSQGRWLDVGCSIGTVVKAANLMGFSAYGVDVEPWGINYGKEYLKLDNLLLGELKEQNYPDNYFNVISVYDVIEHVSNLNDFVKKLKRILAPDGIIDIITPDIGNPFRTGPLSDWKEIKPSEHLYYFNKKTIGLLFNKHGLMIISHKFSFKTTLKIRLTHKP